MGKMKENPRYNVVSCRIDDETFDKIITTSNTYNMSAFIYDAIQEKLERMFNERKTRTTAQNSACYN